MRTHFDMIVQADCYKDQGTDSDHHFVVYRTHIQDCVFTLDSVEIFTLEKATYKDDIVKIVLFSSEILSSVMVF